MITFRRNNKFNQHKRETGLK